MELFTLDKLPHEVLAKLDLQTTFMASRLLVAAERLQLFRELHEKRLRAPTIGRKLKIHPRYLDYFLNAFVSLGFLQKEADFYCNSALAEKYFVQERSVYWTRQFSAECVDAFEAFTVLEKVLRSGRNYRAVMGKRKRDYMEQMKKDPEKARDFTQMLYHFHQNDAEALADYLDLSSFRTVLDVGGGSGVMSIALVKKNPHLRACVLDIEPVCEVAKQLIKKEGFSRRINTLVRDMRKGLPQGYDVIMFCDIGRVQKSLLRMAYKNLPHGGMLVLVDRFLSEDRTEPLDRLLHQFIGSSFGVETRREMTDALRECGFGAIKSHNVYRDVWTIRGLKRKA